MNERYFEMIRETLANQGYSPQEVEAYIMKMQQSSMGTPSGDFSGTNFQIPTERGTLFGTPEAGVPVNLPPNDFWNTDTLDFMTTKQPVEYRTWDSNSSKRGPIKRRTDFATEAEYRDYLISIGTDQRDLDEIFNNEWPGKYPEDKMSPNMGAFPLLFPGGSDLSTELYTLGRSIGAPKGSKGRVATGIAAGGAALFDIARNVASGIGFEKMNQNVMDWYRKQQYGPDSRRYIAAPQTRNTNTTGGPDFLRGGMYLEGGEEGDEMPTQDPQAGAQQMMQQIAQYIQQGVAPQMIIQSLMKKGMDEQQAAQMVGAVVQQMQEGSQNQPTEQADDDPESADALRMKNGGHFKYNVGDTIKFKDKNGEVVEGKIKSIDRKTGKFFI